MKHKCTDEFCCQPFSFEEYFIIGMENDKQDLKQELQQLREEIKCLQIEQNIIKVQQEHLQIRLDIVEFKMRSLNQE